MPRLILLTQHRHFELSFNERETIFDVLKRIGIPSSMVSLVLKPVDSNLISSVSLFQKLSDFKKGDEIYIRVIRNLDIDNFSPVLGFQKREMFTTEWIETFEKPDGSIGRTLVQLNQEEAEKSVIEAAKDFFKEYQYFGKDKILVGASGGGDSNALMNALYASISPDKIIVVTLLGFPDWTEASGERARLLCQKYKFQQIMVSSDEVARCCNFKLSLPEVINSFKSRFGSKEIIFLSTFAIQQCLIKKAEEFKIRDIILGANREDVLGEALYYITRGIIPAPFPVRPFGDYNFGFPLWLVPKKIIDGVHPKLSLENYAERDPGSTQWRDRFYFISHLLEDSSFGGDILLLKGLSKISQTNKQWLKESGEPHQLVVKYADEVAQKNWLEWFKQISY